MKFIFSLGGLAALNLAIAMATQWLVLVYIGPGADTDAYFSAQVLTLIPLTILSDILIRVLVPLLTGLSREYLTGTVKSLLLQSLLGYVVMAVILGLSAYLWVPLLSPGLSGQSLDLTIEMAEVMSVTLIFGGLTTVLKSAYHAEQRFIYPELSQLIASIVVLVGVFHAIPVYGITSVAWGAVIRWTLWTVMLCRWVDWRAPSLYDRAMVKTVRQRARVLLLGASIYKTGPVIDRYLASLGPVGGISLLTFGNQLYGAFLAITDKVFATPLLSFAAKNMKSGDNSQLWRNYRQKLLLTGAMTLAVWALVGLCGKWGLNVLVGYGKFGAGQIDMLWQLMTVMGGMLVAGMAGQLASNCLYALGRTTVVVRLAMINFFICAGIKVLAFNALGIVGIATGIVAYQLLNAVGLHVALMRELKQVGNLA
ncbi:lipid II flippase MurJ [Methylobacter luteus]|uniref:lipid II flippase MurJ n=1 Tax=Methylobacter luteus TaxID=415 RepID=UPI0003F98585|nr:lipid II flippase MurJ [Methylobacter luteus]